MVRKCLGGLRCGRVFRVVAFVPHSTMRLPASRSARPSTHCRPSGLRKRQRNFPGSCFVKVPHFIGANPSHSSAPRLHAVFVPHTAFQPPVPPPGAWRQVLSSSFPALPHSYRRLCSLVIPAGSLDPRALQRQEQLSFVFPKTNFYQRRSSNFERLKKEAERAGWVSVVVGPGKHRSGAAISRRRPFQPQPASPRQAQSIPLPWLLRVGNR
jgi:hypothetical protein